MTIAWRGNLQQVTEELDTKMLLEMNVYKISAQNMKAISVGLAVVFIALKGLSPEKSYNLKRTLIKVYKSFCSCNLDPQKHFEYIMTWGPQDNRSNWKQIFLMHLTNIPKLSLTCIVTEIRSILK